jgi:hypothetical protein
VKEIKNMDGFPKHLNTRRDYEVIKELFSEEQWKPAYQELVDTSIGWLMTSRLEEEQSGTTDDTHEVREVKDHEGTVTERYQYEYKQDPNSKLLRLGFTVEEVEAVLAQKL